MGDSYATPMAAVVLGGLIRRLVEIGWTPPAEVEPEVCVGSRAIADFLNSPQMRAIHGEGFWTLKKTDLSVQRGTLPVVNLSERRQKRRVAKQTLIGWFGDLNTGRDPLTRLDPAVAAELRRRQQYASQIRDGQELRAARAKQRRRATPPPR